MIFNIAATCFSISDLEDKEEDDEEEKKKKKKNKEEEECAVRVEFLRGDRAHVHVVHLLRRVF